MAEDRATFRMKCMMCGTGSRSGSPEEAIAHTAVCRPRWWYWWPRREPYLFAVYAFTAGACFGLALQASGVFS